MKIIKSNRKTILSIPDKRCIYPEWHENEKWWNFREKDLVKDGMNLSSHLRLWSALFQQTLKHPMCEKKDSFEE